VHSLQEDARVDERRPRRRNEPDVHLNLNVRGLPQSPTLRINEICAALRAEGRSVYRLGLGQSPFPVPQPVVEELKVNAHQKDYLAVRGLPQLRSAVSDYYRRTQGVERSGEDVLIGPGSKELMFLLQLVYYGDLLIPTPSWVSYAPQAHIIGRQVQWMATHLENEWHLTPEALDTLCRKDPGRPRLVILNYPSNPTGRTFRVKELRELARVARRYRVILLSDEIYGELHFEGRHVSIARYYPEGTIISGGLSKWCGAGGWRLGTFVFPPSLRWLLDGMAAVASETFTSTSAPIQFAAVRAFEGGTEIEQYLWRARRILKSLAHYTTWQLRSCGALVAVPQGAFYLLPDFEPFRESLRSRGIDTSEALCERLLEETGVAALPGSAFGRPANELTMRLALVDFDGARALAAVDELPRNRRADAGYLRAYCANVVTAVDRLCEWVAE
jgi:aspartate aminotransferase